MQQKTVHISHKTVTAKENFNTKKLITHFFSKSRWKAFKCSCHHSPEKQWVVCVQCFFSPQYWQSSSSIFIVPDPFYSIPFGPKAVRTWDVCDFLCRNMQSWTLCKITALILVINNGCYSTCCQSQAMPIPTGNLQYRLLIQFLYQPKDDDTILEYVSTNHLR